MRNHTLVAALSVGVFGLGLAVADRAGAEVPATEVAHRGYSGWGAPESTHASMRHAIKKGFAGVEFDVRLTEDGRAVLMHDATVDRTTNCTGAVTSFTLAELQKCDASSPTVSARVPTLLGTMQYIDTFDWDGVVFIHVKVKLDSSAAAGLVKAARELTDGERRVIFVVENPGDEKPLRAAGWDGFHEGAAQNDMPHAAGTLSNNYDVERFGFMVHTEADWSATGFAQVVIAYGYGTGAAAATITPERAERVHAEGSLLLGVVGFPQGEAELRAAGADGALV